MEMESTMLTASMYVYAAHEQEQKKYDKLLQ